MNGFDVMVFSFPFVLDVGVEEFLCEFLAFFGELPSPAGAFSGADAVPVDSVGVSFAFEFDQAASQALWRVTASERLGYCRQVFLGDGFLDQVEDRGHVSLWDAVH